MNQKAVKMIVSVLSIMFVFMFLATPVFAESTSDDETGTQLKPSDITVNYGSTDDSKDIKAVAGKVMGFLRNIAVVGGVIILMILGIKYMLGSTDEKAEYKKSLVPLVVGIICVMAATSIMTFIFGMFD